MAPLDAGVLAEMVDVAESILRDYRHGFERVDEEEGCEGCGISGIVSECGRVCCSGHRSATNGSNIRKNWSCGITPGQVDSHIKQNV